MRKFILSLVATVILALSPLASAQQGGGQGGGGGSGGTIPGPTGTGQCFISTASGPGNWTWGSCSGSSSLAFSALTTGTNTTATLTLGSGSTLNTASGSTIDFSLTAPTAFKLPVLVGATTSANGQVGYDTTNKNWHAFGNAVDNFILLAPIAGTYNNNDCAKFSVATGTVTIISAGAACGAGGGGGNVISVPTPNAGDAAYWTDATHIQGITPTGTAAPVRADTPTLITPILGAATATTINKVTITAPAAGSTLTIANGKTLTASNTLTFTGTDASSVAFGTGGTVTYTTNNLSVFAATTSSQLAGVISDEVTTGGAAKSVFAVSLQGSDTALMTAGTVSGTFILLCTDANGGATTVGCPLTGNTTSTSLATNAIPKANGANSLINSSISDDGTTVTISDTGGLSITSAVAGMVSLGQGTVQGLGTNAIGLTSGTAVTSYNLMFPGTAGSGGFFKASTSVNQTGCTASGTLLCGVFSTIDLAAAADVGATILLPANGGTGLSSITAHSVIVGNGTAAMVVIPAAALGTIFAGNTGADPGFLATPRIGGPTAGATGTFGFCGLTSGCVTLQSQAIAGTYNFNLPITVGNAGEVLTTQGGSAAQTWTRFFATNAQTSTYQVVAADFLSCKTIPVASGTFTITLVASGAQPVSGQCIDIINYGSGVVTVATSGQNLNGTSSSIPLSAGSATAPTGLHVVSDGTNYEAQTMGGAGGGGSGTVNNASQYSGTYYSAAGTTNTLSGIAAPITPSGVPQYWVSTNVAGVAAAPAWVLAGVSGRTVSGTSDTIVVADRAGWITYSSASATAITLPQAGSTGFAGNFVIGIKATGAGALTVTPTTSTIDGAATLVITQGQNCTITSLDNTNYVSRCAGGQGTFTSPLVYTASANGGATTCPTCVVASSPGVGIGHFAGSTQTQTSSLIVNADITNTTIDLTTKVTGVLPLANMTQLFVANAQTSTYQVLAADFTGCKTIPVASGTFTITLVASGTQPASGQCVDVINYGSGVVTIARSGQNINGAAANLTLAAGSSSAPTGIHVVSDGTNYVAQTIASGGGAGTVTNIATTSPITGGPITNTGTIACATCTTATTPGAGVAHFAGGTQNQTSSLIVNADITATTIDLTTKVTGVLPFANMSQLFVTNSQTTTYQVLAADFTGCKTISVPSGTFTVTLVASGTQPATGQCVDIVNYGSGVVTVARSGQNINGAAANLTLAAGSSTAPTGLHVVSDGTNYVAQTMGGAGAVASVFTRTGAVVAAANDYTLDLIGNPAADKTFTSAIASTTGVTFSGTAPASVSTATGTNASSVFNVSGVIGGADSNATGTAGIGSSPAIAAGAGGAGTGTNSVGGAGGTLNFTAGNGGASLGTGINSNGGNIIVTPGTAGTGGSGTAGKSGVFQVAGANAGFFGLQQGVANTALNIQIPANTALYQAPVAVTSHFVNIPGAAPTNSNSGWYCSNASPAVCIWSKEQQTFIATGTAYTNASTTFSDVKGSTGQTLAFAVEASTNYVAECYILWSASAATTGPKFQFTGPASPTNVALSMDSAVTATTSIYASATAFSTAVANTGTVTAATNFPAHIFLGVNNGVNAGTVTLQAAANGAGTLTIQDGSWCKAQ